MKHNKEERGPIGNFENLTDSAREYLDMRIDSFKLRVVESLSKLFSKILYVLILIIILAIAVALTASALSIYIGRLLNSEALGSIITAGGFILLATIVILKRKTLFTDSMVKMFIPLFFENENTTKRENKEEQV